MNNYEIEEDEIDIQKLIKSFKKNLGKILFVTFLVGIIVSTYAYFLQAVYTSSVSISFADQQTSKLRSIIPEELSLFKSSESELETIKLILNTRKFINSVIVKKPLTTRYFIEKNFRDNEVYSFDNLKIDLDLKSKEYSREFSDKTLYNKKFIIKPLDKYSFKLKIPELNYEENHHYGEYVKSHFFTLHVLKISDFNSTSQSVLIKDKELLADEILENMTVSILSDNVIKIDYKDTVALRAKELVEAIAKKFISFTLNKKTDELAQTLKFLDSQILSIQNQLKKSGDSLKHYQKKSETFMPMESSVILFEEVNKKEEALISLELQLKELQNFKESLKNNRFNTVSLLYSGINASSIQTLIELFRANSLELNEMNLQLSNIEKSITKNKQLAMLIEELYEKKSLLKELNFNFTSTHPQVLNAKEAIAELKENIKKYIYTNIKRLKETQALTKNKILVNIIMTEKNIKIKIKKIKEILLNKHKLLQSLPEKDLNIQELKRKFLLSEKIYTFLLEKKMELQISKASIVANTQIIEDAREALEPIKPNRKLIIVVGLLVGFILGIIFVTLRSLFDNKIRDVESIIELTNEPIYGTLPVKKNERFFDEALRGVRTNLQFILPKDNRCVVILLSSSIAGEGKTTVNAGLAKVIAHTGKKVLLIDLDLRKSRLYQEFDKSNKVGITNCIIEKLNVNEVIQSVEENLDFLAAGRKPLNPSELLLSKPFDTVLKSLMNDYDYIMFDTPPIGEVIDANILLHYSDIFLLVVEANRAEKHFIEGFNKIVKEKKVKSAGIILNKFNIKNKSGYGYGYGYGYGTDIKDKA
jgi:capsular exopolysaccharide synthesis family protein